MPDRRFWRQGGGFHLPSAATPNLSSSLIRAVSRHNRRKPRSSKVKFRDAPLRFVQDQSQLLWIYARFKRRQHLTDWQIALAEKYPNHVAHEEGCISSITRDEGKFSTSACSSAVLTKRCFTITFSVLSTMGKQFWSRVQVNYALLHPVNGFLQLHHSTEHLLTARLQRLCRRRDLASCLS